MKQKTETYLKLATEARAQQEWRAAERYYTKALRSDRRNARLYFLRGVLHSVQAQTVKDRKCYLKLIQSAAADYKTAHNLLPGDPEIAVSLVEIQICSGHTAEAADYALGLFCAITDEQWKRVCAWLGAIACMLDERPRNEWRQFYEELASAGAAIAATSWNMGDLENYLKVYAGIDVDPETARETLTQHEAVAKSAERTRLEIALRALATSSMRPEAVSKSCYSPGRIIR